MQDSREGRQARDRSDRPQPRRDGDVRARSATRREEVRADVEAKGAAVRERRSETRERRSRRRATLRLLRTISLQQDQATPQEVLARIESGAEVTGSNMYFLIVAILIASIGLNMNSTAVVIGAMLISPLMGVIIGIAYAIANLRADLLRKYVPRLLFQIAISLLTSFVYFSLSPIDTFSGELAARTTPTIWDVLIASCGGFAAIIANTRKSTISNVIPGAAIATALMPPLCTVGYCLSQGRLVQAGTAFYLFLINSIFIALASVVGLQIMGIAHEGNPFASRKNRALLVGVILFAIIPSAYLGYQTVVDLMAIRNFNSFVSQELSFDNTQVVTSSVDTAEKTIDVALIGVTVSDDQIEQARASLGDYGLSDYTLNVTQTLVEQGITSEQLEEILAQQEEEQTDLETLLAVQTNAQELEATTAQDVISLYPSVISAGFVDLYEAGGAATSDDAGRTDAPDSEESPDSTDDVEDSSYCLLLVVSEELGSNELSTLETWASGKLGADVTVVQVLQAQGGTGE